MSGIDSFPDIIRAVTDGWGLLALVVLVLGALALQMTKGASPNVRVGTFVVILGFFGVFLFLALRDGRVAGGDATVAEADSTGAVDSEAIRADREAAERYRESVGGAYDNAANEMNEVAELIAGGSSEEVTVDERE